MIKSKRQPNNLKRILIKDTFNHDSEHDVKRCNRQNCGLCTYLFEGTAFEFNCGRKFYVHETMTCEVKKNDLRHEMQRLRRREYRQNRKSFTNTGHCVQSANPGPKN